MRNHYLLKKHCHPSSILNTICFGTAKAAATREGISNEQIQEPIPDAERARLFGGTDTGRQDGGSSPVADRVSGEQAESINRQQGVLDLDDGGNNGRAGDAEFPKTPLVGTREPAPEKTLIVPS